MYLLNESRLKSFLKGISWRIIGTVDTVILAFFIVGDAIKAASIDGVEVLRKLFCITLMKEFGIKKCFGRR